MSLACAGICHAIVVGLLATVLLIPTSVAAALSSTTPSQPPEAARAEKLIPQLNDTDASVRRRALLQLNSLGGDALPVIEAASKYTQGSPEVLMRLKRALKILRPRAQREQELKQRNEWLHQFFHDAYNRGGHTNAAWDSIAHRAIDEYLKLTADPLHGPSETRDQLATTLKAAAARGCNDPMIRAMNKLVVVHPDASDVEMPTDRFPGGISEFERSSYPALVKLRLVIQYIATIGAQPTMQENAVLQLLPEVLRTPGLPKGEADALAFAFFDIEDAKNGVPNLSHFVQAYQAAAPEAPGPFLLKAKLDLRLAWEAAHTDKRGFGEPFYVKDAKSNLDRAINLDPTDFRGPTLMITWEGFKADEGADTRHEMEDWFRKATELNPDDYDAYSRRLSYLEPIWHGSDAAMLEFGRECVRTENWRARIPFVLVRAHEWLATNSKDAAQYFAQPQVWQDINAVYSGAVLNFPDNLLYRSEYAKYAARCGHWDVAHEQFEKIGDEPVLSVFVSRTSYDYLRRKAARLAPRSTTAPGGE